jgi:Amt family ammonium transporter
MNSVDVDKFFAVASTVWVLMAGILVFFMQAGFAFVESGLVRAKNAVNVIMKNYMDMCVGALGFWALGYGIMFGTNPTGWYGTTNFFPNNLTHWEFTYLFFQMMFAATAATIVSGALAERIRYNAYLLGSFIITTFIYTFFGSWAWNSGGWLAKMGFTDFAGSTVVHSVGGWCALAGIFALGPRIGRFNTDGSAQEVKGHNLPFVALGAFILWFGWFGFNAGSVANLDYKAVDFTLCGKIALNTHLAAAAGGVSTLLALVLVGRPISMAMIINGTLGGLVGVTAPCAFITPGSAIFIGAVAGFIVPYAAMLLDNLRIDDAVGAVSVHGFCGVWGTLAVALFRTDSTGLPYNGLLVQATGCAAAFAIAFPSAYVMYRVIGAFSGLRVEAEEEERGMDMAEHAEQGYPEFVAGHKTNA